MHGVFPARRLLADAKVIGSGPYKLGRYVQDQQAVPTRNPRNSGTAAKTKTVTVQVLEGPGSEIHYLVFDLARAPAETSPSAGRSPR